MQSPPPETAAGHTGGRTEDKSANPETTLGSAYSPVDYMSITSFPRLPEDDNAAAAAAPAPAPGDNTLKLRKGEENALSEQDTDPDVFLKSAHLQRLPSSASDLASHEIASLRETRTDPFTEDCACQRDGLTVIITAGLTFALGVTVALIMQIYLGPPQIFNQGAVVTDVAQCTSLGFDVLERQGSSVDAAIAAALCLGIVHPHTSGIGGMPWKDVVTMAAEVARTGFNVTHDLAEALAKAKDQNMSDAFGHLFLPDGQPPPSGLLTRRLDLAAILDAVASKGTSEFYSENLTREMAAAVQAAGGVLTEEDFGNYSTVLQQPAEIIYQGHHVMAAPAPHAGIALIAALNILEGYNITSQVPRNSTYHWIAEALKISLALASGLGDPMYDTSISDVVAKMLSKSQASLLRQMINDSQAFPVGHYAPSFTLETGAAAAQVMVMGPDDHIVSVMSSLNKPFGSGIVTPSGILLNSQILDFSWPNKTRGSSPNPHNSLQPGKRPMSFLMPTAVRPAVGLCGTYVAVGSSDGEKALSGITQVLMNVLSSRKNMSDSLAYGRLHPHLLPNMLLVDSEFEDEDVELLQAKGHKVERRDVLSLVEGTRRTNDLIIGVKDPRSADASALTMSNVP
uniref:Glutathione hydrolase n=1 Tax=Gasterosteus aculeatus aculeatus TaxID=481459 RepID=A0AAQ4RK43_GASAC